MPTFSYAFMEIMEGHVADASWKETESLNLYLKERLPGGLPDHDIPPDLGINEKKMFVMLSHGGLGVLSPVSLP